MGENVLRLQHELSQLSAADRAAIADYLLGTLDDEEDVENAWDPELDRRYADIVAGTAQGQPLDAVRAEWREEFP